MDKWLYFRDLLKTLNKPTLADQRAHSIAASISRSIDSPIPACLRDLKAN